MQTNNGGSFNKKTKSDNIKVAVNSLQRTLYVERISTNRISLADNVIPYDVDNLYPNKVKAIAQRSGATSSAIKTLSSFISGEGFINPTDNEIIINSEGQTLWDLCRFISDSKSLNDGFALHFNFNLVGQIAEINFINFDTIRKSCNKDTLIYNKDWSERYYTKNKEIEYESYNPKKVQEQILEHKTGYKGQIYYCVPNNGNIYPLCRFDSVIDDAQFEAEAKLYSLSSIQNDYSLSGIISYPKNIESTEGKENVQDELRGDKGSANAGGLRVIPAPMVDGLNNWKWFTPISRNNIDSIHKNQKQEAKDNIYAAFRQPPILNGVSQTGMFNDASFADAFHYYNAQTETERREVESDINKILRNSIWNNVNVEIKPKKYVTREDGRNATNIA